MCNQKIVQTGAEDICKSAANRIWTILKCRAFALFPFPDFKWLEIQLMVQMPFLFHLFCSRS